MKNSMIKVGAAVLKTKVGDPEANAAEIIRTMEGNQDLGILVFPELCVTGYTCADLFGQNSMYDGAMKALSDIAVASAGIPGMTAVVGCPVRRGNALYNCAVFVSEGEVKAVIPKSYIPTYGEFHEGRWFTARRDIVNETVDINGEAVPFGTDILLADENSGVVIAAEICEDLWVPMPPSSAAALAGANIIVNLSASDEEIGKQEYRRSLVSQQSATCYCDYIYVSAGTDESSTDLVFSGHTVIAECGRVLSDSIFGTPTEVNTALLDLDISRYDRLHQNTFLDEGGRDYRRIKVSANPAGGARELGSDALLEILKDEKYPVQKNPFVPSDLEERGKRCRKILRIQANGLATRLRNTGLRTLVIGISGGLDSTLALLVAYEAKKIVPDAKIIAITMPNEGNTTSLTYTNAVKLMKILADDVREIPIGADVASHLADIGHSPNYQGDGDITYENAQARMRTYILMDTANMEGGLVVGTGDLSELALGWCTYNGDHMSMYGVNASIPKTLVRYICESYAYTCGDEELKGVLLSIAATPITPELIPANEGEIAQKTEDKIGNYDLNDFFLYYVMRYGMEPDKILGLARYAYGVEKETVRTALIRFYRRFFSQQFKRSCLPDGPKVGSVTLSPRGDWRMPSDASSDHMISILEKD
ncbi:MAG: NAD(+) synthase [Eubacteriales bacterium]|nr:NAD(+) synthase [Eubacteriales bacterium]